MLGCEIPLTPDQGEARDWLLEELSKGVYGEISGPIVSFVSDLIDGFFRLLSWRGEGTPPISLILTILGDHRDCRPDRCAHPPPDSTGQAPVQIRFRGGDQCSAGSGLVRRGRGLPGLEPRVRVGLPSHGPGPRRPRRRLLDPGLDRREAADAATRVAPGLAPQLSTYAETFDKVRYGHSTITREEVDALRSFTPILLDLCSHAKDLS